MSGNKTSNKCIWNNGRPCSGRIDTRKIFRGQLIVPICVTHYVWHLKHAALMYSGLDVNIGMSVEESDLAFAALAEYNKAQAIIVSALYGSTADLDAAMVDIF